MHNGKMPRDWWLTVEEKEKIKQYFYEHPNEGYRRLTYMMMDDNVVAVSPTTTYRVLKEDDLLGRFNGKPSKKGTGFEQPLSPHEHWHIDISYINIDGTFYYMFTIIDGYSRFIVHWEIHESMKEKQIEIIIERAREMFPGFEIRIISDNGPQFISKDFKEYIRVSGMTHVRTSPYYPQANGKVERVQKTVKQETVRKVAPKNLKEARESVGKYILHYNNERLHCAINYIAPIDKLEGRATEILKIRQRKLEKARTKRKEANTFKIAA